MLRHLERGSLYPSSSLWTVPKLSITLAAMEDCHPKLLSTLNTMVGLKPRKLILTLDKMAPANFLQKISVFKFLTL